MKQLYALYRTRTILRLAFLLAYFFASSSLYAQVPVNDLCGGATILTTASGTTCTGVAGTLKNATATAGVPGGCGSATSAEVWYRFTAGSQFPVIRLTSIGSAIQTATPVVQILSGSCGAWTSLACVQMPAPVGGTWNISTANVAGMAALNVGTQYYIRVTTLTNNGNTSFGTWTFNICVYDPQPARVDYSKSYINVSKGTTGGTVNPGDTLEIRATFVVFSNAVDSISYSDTLFQTRGFKLIPDSLTGIVIRTNEGKAYRSLGPTVQGGDEGWRVQTPGGDTAIRINLGMGATAFARGKLRNTSRPSFFGGTCIIMATYRVVVYAPYNTKIRFGGGTFTYRDTATTKTISTVTFKNDSLMVYQSPGLCPNAVSPTNAVGVESNGTFGAPSTGAPLVRNRTSTFVPGYIYSPFIQTGGPQDYYYTVANNTSAEFSTLNTWNKPDPDPDGAGPLRSHRVFGVWDITGDHTGATNPARGNPACDTTRPVSATNPCGYMLVINSAYKTDTAFQYTVTNLCPNTYYEISAWIKNICYKCSCDSAGLGPSSAGYVPFAPNDSSGVQPNLAFEVNGIDYYTTGNLRYQKVATTTPWGSDSVNIWVKRGFVYLTGTNQTSFTLTIRNNAPGGGGNDWAIDDIAVATCLPNMSYSPSLNPPVCMGNPLTINDTIRSYFNNYVYYKWQRSTDNGVTWTDVTATLGPATPTLIGSVYQYVTSYTIPPGATSIGDDDDRYRVIVATTAPNVNSATCQVTDGVSIITLNVLDCGDPLLARILSFNGKLIDTKSHLKWVTAKEIFPYKFQIEKSFDGSNFSQIGTVDGYNDSTSEANHYSFVDPVAVSGRAWYRIAMIAPDGKTKFSQTILLTKNTSNTFGFGSVINPFDKQLDFELIADKKMKIEVALIDISGKNLMRRSYTINDGVNAISLEDLGPLSPGTYILQVINQDTLLNRKVVKK